MAVSKNKVATCVNNWELQVSREMAWKWQYTHTVNHKLLYIYIITYIFIKKDVQVAEVSLTYKYLNCTFHTTKLPEKYAVNAISDYYFII